MFRAFKVSNEVVMLFLLGVIILTFYSLWYLLEHFVILFPLLVANYFIVRHFILKEIEKKRLAALKKEKEKMRISGQYGRHGYDS